MNNKLLTTLLLIIAVVFISCNKDDVYTAHKSNATKGRPVFSSGSPSYTFANGTGGNTYSPGQTTGNFSGGSQNGNNFGGGNPGNNFGGGGSQSDDASCLIGRWIQAGPCPQGYHLMLQFNNDGSGICEHLAVSLCTVETNMPTSFTWTVSNGQLHIQFNLGYVSNTPLSCPSQEIMIMWLGNNQKILTKQAAN